MALDETSRGKRLMEDGMGIALIYLATALIAIGAVIFLSHYNRETNRLLEKHNDDLKQMRKNHEAETRRFWEMFYAEMLRIYPDQADSIRAASVARRKEMDAKFGKF